IIYKPALAGFFISLGRNCLNENQGLLIIVIWLCKYFFRLCAPLIMPPKNYILNVKNCEAIIQTSSK
ncbi:MAG TPA: hypothetical protein VF540_05095, partial [Segetibacter sp.]